MPVYKSSTATKDGRRYYFSVSWVDALGNQHRHKSAKFKLREECQKAEAKFRLNLNKSVASDLTFSKLIDEYISVKEKSVKPSTLNNTRNCLAHTRKALGKVKVSRLTNNQWQAFLKYLEEQPMKNHRRNRIIEYTTAVCNYAHKRYDVFTSVPQRFDKFNEQADKPVDKKMEFYTPEQFQSFISVVDDLVYRTLFTLLYATGMRSGEALALSWSDIDFDARTVSISKTVNTKFKGQPFVIMPPKTRSSVRTIRVPNTALSLLADLMSACKVNEDFSPDKFVFGYYRPIPNSTLQTKKHHYWQLAHDADATLPEIRVHSFRHSCASALINSGATIVYISKYLGHSSTKETLDTYAHFFPNESDVVALSMDNLLKKCT